MDVNKYLEICRQSSIDYMEEKKKHTEKTEKPPFPTDSIENALTWYYMRKNDGARGNAAETFVNWYLTGRIEKVKGRGEKDISLKNGGLEVKTGCGEIVKPIFYSKQEVIDFISKNEIAKTIQGRYFCYAPSFFNNAECFRIFPKQRFIDILTDLKLLVIKKSTAGLYGISIQRFDTSKRKEAAFYERLNEGQTLEEYKKTHSMKF